MPLSFSQSNDLFFVALSAYIPQQQKTAFDSVVASSKPGSSQSDFDSVSTIKAQPSTATPAAVAAPPHTTAAENKLVSQQRYN